MMSRHSHARISMMIAEVLHSSRAPGDATGQVLFIQAIGSLVHGII